MAKKKKGGGKGKKGGKKKGAKKTTTLERKCWLPFCSACLAFQARFPPCPHIDCLLLVKIFTRRRFGRRGGPDHAVLATAALHGRGAAGGQIRASEDIRRRILLGRQVEPQAHGATGTGRDPEGRRQV
jgi:hypothetical protein